MDTAEAGRAAGVKSAVVSGGYIQEEPLKQLCRRVDAIKIDLKAFSDKFYKEVVNGELKPVLNTLAAIRKQGTWNEIVYLVIPTLNDSEQEFKALARWVKTELGPDVPLHFSQFHPEYLLKNLRRRPSRPSARQSHLRRRRAALRLHRQHPRPSGREHLLPQVPAAWCGARRLRREAIHLNRGKCKFCQTSHSRSLGRITHL